MVRQCDSVGIEDVPWSKLTMQSVKVHLYRNECSFMDAWTTLNDILADASLPFLLSHSFIVLKPEAIARRIGPQVLDYLACRGFHAVACMRLRLTHNKGQAMWRYQWNVATTDRVRLASSINAMSESLLIMLRSRRSPLPASVRLWDLKGPTDASRRRHHHLRSQIGMSNRMIGYVHLPDEPADVARELGILLDPETRASFLSQALRGNGISARAMLSRVCVDGVYPAHPVEFGQLDLGTMAISTQRLVTRIQAGERFPLSNLSDLLNKDPGLCAWDRLTIAAEGIHHDRPGLSPLINSKAVAEIAKLWNAHANSGRDQE